MLNKLKDKKSLNGKFSTTNFTKLGNYGTGHTSFNTKGLNDFQRTSVIAFPKKETVTNQLLAFESGNDFADFMPHLESTSVAAGEYLYKSDEHSNYVYFPETAVISHLHTSADGKTVEIAMIGSEGVSGLSEIFGTQPSAHCAQVTVGGSVTRIKTDLLKQEFHRGGDFQIRLLDYMNAHILQISQRIVCESFHVIEERLSSWLLMLQDRAQKDQWQITHEQISLILGVNRPTITQAAKNLREKELIDYSRGKFYIVDREGLEFRACECYSTLQNVH
ncbi:MAG TPA: Crp/Fnr family transcriptional regulator [Pyrinomonadaceae bacterium]|jgi:CRP-like cAMP-binding protein